MSRKRRKDPPAGSWQPSGLIGRATDAAFRAVAPTVALRRQRSRQMLALGDGFDVTKLDRRHRHGSITGGGADEHMTPASLKQLRELCRSHDRNGSPFAAMLNRAGDHIIGPEFRWHADTSDKALNRDLDAYVAERATPARADVRGMCSLVELCRLWQRAIWTDGDALVQHHGDGGLVSHEADQLVSPLTADPKRRIVNGVEIDPKTGRPLAYWISDRGFGGWVNSLEDAARVDVRDCHHVANLRRTSQTRGVPELASPLSLYERLDAYIDNESFAAEVDAMLAFFIQTDPAYADGVTLGPGRSQQTAIDGTVETLQKVRPGQIVQIPPGGTVSPFKPERPGTIFAPYVNSVLGLIGASVGMPLILVTLDFSRVNYSSARAALLEARRTFRRWQSFVKNRMFLPIYRRWIGQAIREGQFPISADIFDVQLHFPGWEWIDPLKEIQAHHLFVAGGFGSHSEVCEARGVTFADVCAARARDHETLREHGLTVSLTGSPPNPAETADADAADREENRQADEADREADE